MIKPGEIQNKARIVGVRDQQIEKDYILSWILQGIAHHESLAEKLSFKGGTVLKKAYFKDYRFSEDLDFTLLDNAGHGDEILNWFSSVFEIVKEKANIPLELIDNDFGKLTQDNSINFHIGYTGPLGGLGAHKKVKVDISRNEKLEFDSAWRDIAPDYSDQKAFRLQCYSLEEVMLEKLRSVMQRMQARDFYDIWYLLEHGGIDVDLLLPEFEAKCESKQLKAGEFYSKLQQRIPQYKGRWKQSLSSQIKNLPEFDQVEREVLRRLKGFG